VEKQESITAQENYQRLREEIPGYGQMLDEQQEEMVELRRKSIYEDQIMEMVVFNSIIKVTDRTLHYQTNEEWCTATWEALARVKVNTRRKFLQNIPKINAVLR
jgi:hypothetical protein